MKTTYKPRTLSDTVRRVSDQFKVLLLNGPRQIGKTTLFAQTAEKGRRYVSLDDPQTLLLAKTDPKGFLAAYAPPCIIDEIQYAPELFPYIKMLVDGTDRRGGIWMTGSQQYNLMQGVTESLAGRVAILDMLGFSLYERAGIGARQIPFIPSPEPPRVLKWRNAAETFDIIWLGAYPDIANAAPDRWNLFYNSYVRSYLERDVRQMIQLGNEITFFTFLKVIAARTGQELNLADVARDVGTDPKTAGKWLSVLRASGLVFLLQPYSRNITKRLTKRPKLYFTDTGLAAHLAGWTTPRALETGASAGAFFETFVITEILKSYLHNGLTPDLSFYRDSNRFEIDLLLFQNGLWHPVEIKKHATPGIKDIAAFKTFAKLERLGHGCEICLTPAPVPLAGDVTAISIWDI